MYVTYMKHDSKKRNYTVTVWQSGYWQRTAVHVLKLQTICKRIGIWCPPQQIWTSASQWYSRVSCQDSQKAASKCQGQWTGLLLGTLGPPQQSHRDYGNKSSSKDVWPTNQDPVAHNCRAPEAPRHPCGDHQRKQKTCTSKNGTLLQKKSKLSGGSGIRWYSTYGSLYTS